MSVEIAPKNRQIAPVVEAVRVSGVRKHWRGQPKPVLDGVDLLLPPACVVWLGGANGVGKTPLLRIITGVLDPDGGEVSLHGYQPRQHDEYHSRLSFLSAASAGLFNRLTVRQHLEYRARLSFVPFEDRRRRVAEALDRFELHELAGRRADRMSMGQRQRVRLAMAFLPHAEVILLDEPSNSLDDRGQELLAAAAQQA